MEKLSVVVIACNESEHIKRCLDSAKAIADEMIVVDSGSTDNTVEIAKSCGAKVYFHSWMGFGEQKNYADELTENQWILSLDADEYLTPELCNEIALILINPKNKAYKLKRRNFYCGRWLNHSGWYPDAHVRLFHKDYACWNTNRVHETLSVKQGELIGNLKNDLKHYTFQNTQDHWQCAKKYALLGAEQIYINGKKPTVLRVQLTGFHRFIWNYVFRLGFLDGKQGFLICQITSQYATLKYKEAYRLFMERNQ